MVLGRVDCQGRLRPHVSNGSLCLPYVDLKGNSCPPNHHFPIPTERKHNSGGNHHTLVKTISKPHLSDETSPFVDLWLVWTAWKATVQTYRCFCQRNGPKQTAKAFLWRLLFLSANTSTVCRLAFSSQISEVEFCARLCRTGTYY